MRPLRPSQFEWFHLVDSDGECGDSLCERCFPTVVLAAAWSQLLTGHGKESLTAHFAACLDFAIASVPLKRRQCRQLRKRRLLTVYYTVGVGARKTIARPLAATSLGFLLSKNDGEAETVAKETAASPWASQSRLRRTFSDDRSRLHWWPDEHATACHRSARRLPTLFFFHPKELAHVYRPSKWAVFAFPFTRSSLRPLVHRKRDTSTWFDTHFAIVGALYWLSLVPCIQTDVRPLVRSQATARTRSHFFAILPSLDCLEAPVPHCGTWQCLAPAYRLANKRLLETPYR